MQIIEQLADKAISGCALTRSEAEQLIRASEARQMDLFCAAHRIRGHFRGDAVDLCAIISAKSGACSEDCAYCAQSRRSSAEIATHPLVSREEVFAKAEEAKASGARRFCIVTSGRKPSASELALIAEMIRGVRTRGLLPCATLGLLTENELQLLRQAGLERFHNNLETSERFFPRICSSHSFADKIRTLRSARNCGLSLCSGGIFGLGETWDDRIDMALSLRDLSPDSVPINFLTPISGTVMGGRPRLDPAEALRIISLFRFMLPDKEIRVCGGRLPTLGEMNSLIFLAGADGLLIGNYLTTPGRSFRDDLELISRMGLVPVP